MKSQQFRPDELEREVLRDLIDDVQHQCNVSEQALMLLDRNPHDTDLLHQLFRAVHTIKGNLGISGFSPLMPMISAAEDILGLLREGRLAYSMAVSDLLLVMLDQVDGFLQSCLANDSAQYQPQAIDNLVRAIAAIVAAPENANDQQFDQALAQLDPTLAIAAPNPDQHQEKSRDTLAKYGFDDPDLHFFRQVIAPIETRSEYWQGRNDRILKLALILNALANDPVDRMQLAAAVYVHDFGMAFMPLNLLHHEGTLQDDEIILLRSHVLCSAQLLQNMPRWREAREIVQQHHEAVDGSGYPNGLRDQQICDGAKILAIADTFDALTHQRAHKSHLKRPVVRAVREINELAGKQLCRHWVERFNQAVQPVLLAHHSKHFQ